jgi:hypothetical protein
MAENARVMPPASNPKSLVKYGNAVYLAARGEPMFVPLESLPAFVEAGWDVIAPSGTSRSAKRGAANTHQIHT